VPFDIHRRDELGLLGGPALLPAGWLGLLRVVFHVSSCEGEDCGMAACTCNDQTSTRRDLSRTPLSGSHVEEVAILDSDALRSGDCPVQPGDLVSVVPVTPEAEAGAAFEGLPQ